MDLYLSAIARIASLAKHFDCLLIDRMCAQILTVALILLELTGTMKSPGGTSSPKRAAGVNRDMMDKRERRKEIECYEQDSNMKRRAEEQCDSTLDVL